MIDPEMRLNAVPASEAAVAFALFEHIAAKDPSAVAAKDDAIAVFRECMEAVGHRVEPTANEPRPIRVAPGRPINDEG